jgi:antitoxin component of MazEF toxin-antitoxin module
MEQLFETKVRKIGTSLGVLIPKRLLASEKIRNGEEIEIAVLKRKRLDLIENSFGIAKGAAGFRRVNADRV